MVGGLGFLINLVVLTSLHSLFKLSITLSQLIGSEVALFSNFLLHNTWTYKKNTVTKSFWSLFVQFHATSWPAIIGSTVMVSAFVNYMHMSGIEALVLASAIALLWNYAWSKYVIWRDISKGEI